MAKHVKKKPVPQNLSLQVTEQRKFSKKVKEIKDQGPKPEASNVVYIGHIPHGFYEDQMREFFTQFGDINRLRISRSKKTGGCRGYGFIEFEQSVVAKIVADTMNNYLMFNRLLKCRVVPMEKLHKDTFKHAERAFRPPMAHKQSIARHNAQKTACKLQGNLLKAKSRKRHSLQKLADMGIDFEYPGLVKVVGKSAEENESASVIPLEKEDDATDEDSMSEDEMAKEAVAVLYEDSSEEDISFRTPPNTRRKSLSLLMTPDTDGKSKTPRRKSSGGELRKAMVASLAGKMSAKDGKTKTPPAKKVAKAKKTQPKTDEKKKSITKLGGKRAAAVKTKPAKKKK